MVVEPRPHLPRVAALGHDIQGQEKAEDNQRVEEPVVSSCFLCDVVHFNSVNYFRRGEIWMPVEFWLTRLASTGPRAEDTEDTEIVEYR